MASIVAPLYAPAGSATMARIHPHQLAILFAVLAAGAQLAPVAQQYHILARAAFSLAPLKREANVTSVQALFLLMWVMRNADPKSHEERWLLGGVCIKVAQQVLSPPILNLIRSDFGVQIGLRECLCSW